MTKRDIGPQRISTGTIGGPESFAGQALAELRRKYPELLPPRYFETAQSLFAAFANREFDAIVGSAATIAGYGKLDEMLAEQSPSYFVVAEAQLPFGCSLLARGGALLEAIRIVHGGPASLEAAGGFLSANLPAAETRHYGDPFSTAQSVARGDGSEAIIGTRALAERFALSVLAPDIDGGTVNGNWWALSAKPLWSSSPELVIVAARFGDDGKFGQLCAALGAAGFSLSSASARATRHGLLEFDYVLRFRGSGELDQVRDAVSSVPGSRLAGAIDVRC